MILFSENGAMITEQRTVVNKFNKYFINAEQNLLKELGESNNKFQDYLANPNENSFFLKEIEPDEIYRNFQIISESKYKKGKQHLQDIT